MNTVTVTIHHSTNYGATLQAYALQRALLSLGHDNLIFEYPYKNNNIKSKERASLKSCLRKVYLNYLNVLRRNRVTKLRSCFVDFHNSKMMLTRVYDSMNDLRSNPPLADAYITGSDQVWNLSTINEFSPARFLDFGNDKTIRISYAASIENLSYSSEEIARVKDYLSKFKAISLREQSACDYIESITGYKTTRVIDPVFLLNKDEWIRVSKQPRIEGNYILVYQVLRNRRMQEVVDYLKKLTGYKVVQICNTAIKWINADYTFFDVSPEEFIGFFNNASIVVSGSFHGAAFGILFGKCTYGLIKNVSGNRIKELFDVFDISDYCIDNNAEIAKPLIDNELLLGKVERERSEGLLFLSKNLVDY